MRLARTVSRSLGMVAVAFGLATTAAAPAAAHAWSLSVDDATMAWSLGLTAEALDMLATAGVAANLGNGPGGSPAAPGDPTNLDEARDSPALSAHAKVVLSQVGLEVYPIDGPDAAGLVAAYRFDVTSGRGAADDADWHDVISFGPRCAGCAGEADTTLDLLADFTRPPVPDAPED